MYEYTAEESELEFIKAYVPSMDGITYDDALRMAIIADMRAADALKGSVEDG